MYLPAAIYVGTSISVGTLINRSSSPMLYTITIPLKDNILTKLQEATPLKKKLDEFGTFLAKVLIMVLSTSYEWVFFPFPKPKSSVRKVYG
jgi:hypothetical protein